MQFIGQELEQVNYIKTWEGLADYSTDPKADFDYLPLGLLYIKLSNGISYRIADYNSTKLAISGVGIQTISNGQPDLTQENPHEAIREKWANHIGHTITDVFLYLQTEKWANYKDNEIYPESLEIQFDNGKSIFYFCGDVDEYSDIKNRYELLGGRDSGIIFFDKATFSKYELDKVYKIEKLII